MIEPLRPEDVADKGRKSFPDEVIKAFNTLIAKHWDGIKSNFNQDEAVEEIIEEFSKTANIRGIDRNGFNVQSKRQEIFDNRWLDIEYVYQQQGWNVVFDKPGYCEDYVGNWTFTK